MLKKIILSLFFAMSLAGASAQHVPGSWKVIPMTGTTYEYVQETPDKVYFLSGGSLYSFDKDDNETLYYSPGSKISDSGISFMKYNGDQKYLLLAYSNGNIDLLYDNGKIVNLPEIKNSNLTMAKTINDVQFGRNRIYAATNFGIVVFDDANHHVIESGIYNESIPRVLEIGDYIALWKDVNGSKQFAYSLKKDRHNTLDKFTPVQACSYDVVLPLSDNSYLVLSGGTVTKVTFNPSADSKLSFSTVVSGTGGKGLYAYKDGFYVPGSNGFYLINKNGDYDKKVDYATSFGGQTLSFWSNPSEFWAGNSDGIGRYSLTDNKYINEKFTPSSSKQFKTWYRVNHPNGKEVYFNEVSRTECHPGSDDSNDNMYKPFLLESYNWETGEIKSVHPVDANGNALLGGSGRIAFDKKDPSFYYWANNTYGLYVIKDRKVHYIYDRDNSPVWKGWMTNTYEVQFDNNNNLWVMCWRAATQQPQTNISPTKILPESSLDLVRSDPEKVTTQDENQQYVYWLQPEWVPQATGRSDGKIALSSISNKGLATNGGWGTNYVGIDNNGTTPVNDDKYQYYSGLLDQDGTVTSPTYTPWFEEDKEGDIWIGTNVGVFILHDLKQIADGSSNYISVIRPKVARNDGTNYADYLLSSDHVLNIAVDPTNRKWIATSTSGLYCVSPDGSEIIYEFNKDNSPLVSNTVYMVACDPVGNDVLIGTPDGLYVFSSDSAPAKDDYSEVYAYPNPVRPDYNGWISINGLMDNSLIKITDSQGNPVWEGKSEGGMAVWDGCDKSGNRVRSGVYMVMASQNSNGNSGAVTKIVVVN